MASKSSMWGVWGKLGMLGTRFRNALEPEKVEHELHEIAEYILEEVKAHIEAGTLNLTAISYRRDVGDQDNPILIASHEWLDSLEVADISIAKGSLTLFIGGSDRVLRKGLTSKQLTEYIEEGTFKQPPRPAFHLTWEEIRPEVRERVIQVLGKDILKASLELRF